MDSIRDFEDLLFLLEKHQVKYLIVGGLAFIFHAKPRFTKDMDLWIHFTSPNIKKANLALKEFGSPFLLSPEKMTEIVQIGVAPNRIDLIPFLEGTPFTKAWNNRIHSTYGKVKANWIGLDDLIQIKKLIPAARHQEDYRVLMEVKMLKTKPNRKKKQGHL